MNIKYIYVHIYIIFDIKLIVEKNIYKTWFIEIIKNNYHDYNIPMFCCSLSPIMRSIVKLMVDDFFLTFKNEEVYK